MVQHTPAKKLWVYKGGREPGCCMWVMHAPYMQALALALKKALKVHPIIIICEQTWYGAYTPSLQR